MDVTDAVAAAVTDGSHSWRSRVDVTDAVTDAVTDGVTLVEEPRRRRVDAEQRKGV